MSFSQEKTFLQILQLYCGVDFILTVCRVFKVEAVRFCVFVIDEVPGIAEEEGIGSWAKGGVESSA